MAKFCFVPLALLMACYAVQVYGAPPDELTVAWENFLAHHPIKGASPQELAKRKGNFAKAHAMIEKHNKNKNATFHMAHNKFSIMDDHEKKKYTGVHLPSHPKDVKYFDANESAVSTRQLPRSLNYRFHMCMPEVKDQGWCGSCWAFTAITPLEFAQCLRDDMPVRLSEQQLVDCTYSRSGCSGGWYTTAWDYLMNGSAEESLYPYTAEGETCKYDDSMKTAVVSSYEYVRPNSPYAMRTALMNYGPLAVAVAIVDSFFQYESGVYNDPACDPALPLSHGLVIVGWGTYNGIPFWVCRNSWGSGWGRGGYIQIERGVNRCDIEAHAAVITGIV